MWKHTPKRAIGHTTKEIYKNDKYLQVPSLKWVIDPVRDDLSQLLSIKIEQNKGNNPISREFVIDAKDYSYYITTQQWLDLVFAQFDKATWKTIRYSPYSDSGYDFFASLIAGHHHFFKSAPVSNFTQCDSKRRKEGVRNLDLPLRNELESFYMNFSLHSYLFYEELFKKDSENIYRFHHPAGDDKSGWEKYWLWFTDNEMIVKISHTYPWWTEIGPLEFHINKHLLQIIIQAYIDTNRFVSGPVASYNVKKVKDAVINLLSNPTVRKDDEKRPEVLHNTLRWYDEWTEE